MTSQLTVRRLIPTEEELTQLTATPYGAGADGVKGNTTHGSARDFLFVAEQDGVIVGVCHVHVYNRVDGERVARPFVMVKNRWERLVAPVLVAHLRTTAKGQSLPMWTVLEKPQLKIHMD